MFNKTEIYVAVNYITHWMSCRAQSKHYTVGPGAQHCRFKSKTVSRQVMCIHILFLVIFL